jgi:hypothetical protein
MGSFVGTLLLCAGLGYFIYKKRHPSEPLVYEPTGDSYALLQSMHTEEDDVDSEDLLEGRHGTPSEEV